LKYQEIYSKAMSILKEQGKHELFRKSRELGTESGYVHRHNLEFFNTLNFEMRLIDTELASTETRIFGHELRTPVMSGAISGLQQFTDDPLLKIARGIRKAGSMMWLGVCPPEQVEPVIKIGAPTIVIVKPYKDNKEIERRIVEAEEKGAIAVGIDIDFFFGGKRGDDEIMAGVVSPKSTQELKGFRSITKLPFVLKGILSVIDAEKAEKMGADAICISNHGGAVLDHAAHPLQVLPDIKKAVSNEMIVLADSGFRRGTDVLKALALGADGVLMGYCMAVGLIADGEEGVKDIIDEITSELRRAMSLTGCRNLSCISKQILHEA
jgi:4-hydroxymandelate oxidase